MEQEAVAALMIELIRAGVVPEDAVLAAADRCEVEGEETSAHQLRCLVIEAGVEPVAAALNSRRPRHLRLVPDGGN